MEEINIKDFLQYLRKYTVVIILITCMCILGTVVYNMGFKTPTYTTSTTILLVKNDSSSGNTTVDGETITQNDITLNQKLVSTYRHIIKSKLVLNQVISKLGLEYSYEELYKFITVEAVEDTEIIRISVTDSNAIRATDIANKVAEVFDNEITQIYNINNVSVIDRALISEEPSNNTLIRDAVLAVFVALVGSTAIVFVVFYFDDRLRYSENMESEIELPVIAKVFKDTSGIDLVVDQKPNALASEAIRNLRTNLQFSSVDSELKTILVTSTIPSEGKSFISANLAISFAQTGKKVLLVDCDLRKGRQHGIFNVLNKKGLSNLLIQDIEDYKDYVAITSIKNLSLIPRGAFPPNPSELLNSKKNAALIELLKKQYDIVILDGAPCSGLSDSLILSSLVDKVILVSSVNYTPKTELKNVKKSLENVGANLAGCVVNGISTKKGTYGGHYYYYSYGEKEQASERSSRISSISKENR